MGTHNFPQLNKFKYYLTHIYLDRLFQSAIQVKLQLLTQIFFEGYYFDIIIRFLSTKLLLKWSYLNIFKFLDGF
jgi:hypothetical protein